MVTRKKNKFRKLKKSIKNNKLKFKNLGKINSKRRKINSKRRKINSKRRKINSKIRKMKGGDATLNPIDEMSYTLKDSVTSFQNTLKGDF